MKKRLKKIDIIIPPLYFLEERKKNKLKKEMEKVPFFKKSK